MPGWQRMAGLLQEVGNFTVGEVHRRLGTLRWLLDEGHYDHRAFFEHVGIDVLRIQFPMLPSDDDLEAVGRVVAREIAEGLAAALCSDAPVAHGVRRIVEGAAALAFGPHLAVAISLAGGLLIVPVAATLCGHVLGSWLAARGMSLTCDNLRAYLEAHP
jgi:hypothetical protein